jgi:AGZA family xanthine/uracil permease-like MFS transporter
MASVGPKFGSDGTVNPVGWGLNIPKVPDTLVGTPDFGLLGKFDIFGGFNAIGAIAAILAIFSLMLSDFFDTMGTVVGLAGEAELLDENGEPPALQNILVVDSIAAIAGGMASTSSNTSYIESASGIGEGARTGLASVVTGVLFLLATFIAPVVGIVPSEAASPALVVVGFLMMLQIKNIDFSDFEIGIPAFLAIALMPFTYSITNGIGAGFVSYVVIKAANGKGKEVKPLMWLVAALFVVYFAIHPIKELLGL